MRCDANMLKHIHLNTAPSTNHHLPWNQKNTTPFYRASHLPTPSVLFFLPSSMNMTKENWREKQKYKHPRVPKYNSSREKGIVCRKGQS